MTAEQALPRKNNDIEVLRAFAILYTVILHLRVLLPAKSPPLALLDQLDLSVGVDLFLVISGFVITGSVMDSARHPVLARRPLMFAFWIKRVFRLLPAAWTWVVIACLVQLLIMAVTDLPYSLGDVLLSAAAAMGNMPRCRVEEPNATVAASSTSVAIRVRVEARMKISTASTSGNDAPSWMAQAI